MNRGWCTLVCLGALVAGCAAPDLRRGKAALEAGDVEAAEQDLAPLAQLGFDDAKLQLARVYARREDPQSRQQAIALYRELLQQDPAVAVPLARTLLADGNPTAVAQAEAMLLEAQADGNEEALVPLLDLYSDFPERDRKKRAPALAARVAKIRTVDAESTVIKWYRRNAPADERYAKELIRLCERGRERQPECYVDLARHYRTVGDDKALRGLVNAGMARFNAGELPTAVLERLGWSLVSDDYPGKPLPEVAHPMLQAAAEVSDVAAVRLARLLIEYPHLDPDGAPEKLLLGAAEAGNPDAALALGRLYLDGKLAPADPARAAKYFERAAPDVPAAHYYLGRIYKRGYLGRSDPIRAAQHFLTAARGGYARADQALAQLFSDNRGVRPNLANAYVFATIAARQETPEGVEMLRRIRAALKPAQIKEGERLLRQELAIRSTPPSGAPTALSMQSTRRAESTP